MFFEESLPRHMPTVRGWQVRQIGESGDGARRGLKARADIGTRVLTQGFKPALHMGHGYRFRGWHMRLSGGYFRSSLFA